MTDLFHVTCDFFVLRLFEFAIAKYISLNKLLAYTSMVICHIN